MATPDAALLGTFQKHIEDMRSLIHCKICLKPFYEPFALTCGHTYCYSCLSGWLNGSHNRGEDKNCPDCRQVIKSVPSPNYTLRDLVHMFLNRAELLPEDETIAEHAVGIADEAKILADDRKGPGLFKGRFGRSGRYGRTHTELRRVFRDASDGVERCPECMWELEEGVCNSCGWPQFSDMSESQSDDGSFSIDMAGIGGYNSDEDERDVSPVDNFGAHQAFPIHRRPDASDAGSDSGNRSPLYYSLDEDERDSEMEDFIDDEEDYPEETDHADETDHTTDGEGTQSEQQWAYNPAHGWQPVDDHELNYGPNGRLIRRRHSPLQSPERHRVHVPESERVAINIDSDDDDSSETSTQATVDRDETTTNAEEDTATEIQTNDDAADESDDSSVREISPPPMPASGLRKRRIVDSDEDGESEPSSEESDDTAVRAPQSSTLRNRRLVARRQQNDRSTERRRPSPLVPERSPSPPVRSANTRRDARPRQAAVRSQVRRRVSSSPPASPSVPELEGAAEEWRRRYGRIVGSDPSVPRRPQHTRVH